MAPNAGFRAGRDLTSASVSPSPNRLLLALARGVHGYGTPRKASNGSRLTRPSGGESSTTYRTHPARILDRIQLGEQR